MRSPLWVLGCVIFLSMLAPALADHLPLDVNVSVSFDMVRGMDCTNITGTLQCYLLSDYNGYWTLARYNSTWGDQQMCNVSDSTVYSSTIIWFSVANSTHALYSGVQAFGSYFIPLNMSNCSQGVVSYGAPETQNGTNYWSPAFRYNDVSTGYIYFGAPANVVINSTLPYSHLFALWESAVNHSVVSLKWIDETNNTISYGLTRPYFSPVTGNLVKFVGTIYDGTFPDYQTVYGLGEINGTNSFYDMVQENASTVWIYMYSDGRVYRALWSDEAVEDLCTAGYHCSANTEYFVTSDCLNINEQDCGNCGCEGEGFGFQCLEGVDHWECVSAYENWHYNTTCHNDVQLFCDNGCTDGDCVGEVSCASDSECPDYCDGDVSFYDGSCNLGNYSCTYLSTSCASGCNPSTGGCYSQPPLAPIITEDQSPVGVIGEMSAGILGFVSSVSHPLLLIIFIFAVAFIILGLFSLMIGLAKKWGD